ncbi:MAG TPA: hypothetical protein VFU97_24575 [Xanthobacteraceae bacterium]|nr:hypothetical protein [Xanthobacteraceae bacterium]
MIIVAFAAVFWTFPLIVISAVLRRAPLNDVVDSLVARAIVVTAAAVGSAYLAHHGVW